MNGNIFSNPGKRLNAFMEIWFVATLLPVELFFVMNLINGVTATNSTTTMVSTILWALCLIVYPVVLYVFGLLICSFGEIAQASTAFRNELENGSDETTGDD